MYLLEFFTLLAAGFTASAEASSHFFVHPVIRRLPAEHHIRVEQGLLRTFGRVMPLLMPATVALSAAYALVGPAQPGTVGILRWVAAILFAAAVAVTLAVNVPINRQTAQWDPLNPPGDWQRLRTRWERFQNVRSILLLVGFALLTISIALR
jgi:uncharacterized membrane protein